MDTKVGAVITLLTLLVFVVILTLARAKIDNLENKVRDQRGVIALLEATQCDSNRINNLEQKMLEYGYLTGQIAALKNVIVVAKDTVTGFWEWIGSPNKDSTPAIFNPHMLGKDY